jgi:uncharacterized protein
VIRRTLTAAGLAGAGALAYATLVERRWYALRHATVPGVLRRPGARLRILHVSDLHLAPGQEHRVRFLASLAHLDHDLVVATGDLLEGTDMEEQAAAALAPLTSRGRPGLAVLGSHDRFGPTKRAPWSYLRAPSDAAERPHGPPLDTPRLIDALAAAGYETLLGGTTTVTTDAGTVAVGGIDDPHLETTVIPPVEALRPGVDDAVLHLGLVHAPYTVALDRLLDAGHRLILSGHTHGGQLRMPGYGALVANCDLPLAKARGLSRHGGGWLHVSAGLGHSRYAPIRFACRPEATLLELTG